jgi:hypothetical protein
MEFMTDNKTKSKSKLGVGKSGRKRMSKKEASKWFQTLTRLERSLLKQEKNSSSSSSSSDEEKKNKKEMHERERELLLKRRSEHEARMKAQLQSKAEITNQIRKCKDMRSQLIPFQMRLAQMQMRGYHCASSELFYNLGNLDSKVSNELRFIKNEEKVLFDMQHKHHCIKNSIKDIIAKRTTHSNLYTKVQAKNYVDDVLGV